jgi:hypothetical protein
MLRAASVELVAKKIRRCYSEGRDISLPRTGEGKIPISGDGFCSAFLYTSSGIAIILLLMGMGLFSSYFQIQRWQKTLSQSEHNASA